MTSIDYAINRTQFRAILERDLQSEDRGVRGVKREEREDFRPRGVLSRKWNDLAPRRGTKMKNNYT